MMEEDLRRNCRGVLARKLQRGASLVNAGLSVAVQTVLDAATILSKLVVLMLFV